jgi:hypothetical protein
LSGWDTVDQLGVDNRAHAAVAAIQRGVLYANQA